MKERTDYETFQKLDIRIGRIISVDSFPEARKPAYKLKIYFGDDIGILNSSAQITNYKPEDLLGRLVVAVVNFPPKRVANFISQVLVLGSITKDGVKLLSVDEGAVPGDYVA
ncbi:tRNA-binding protein [Thermoplasma volcanium]|uniref:tRNA-binding protein n=1 Tax=Thermoplasma volcanium TaxID=50339 RepID=UPI0000164D91